jgi:hypothetical protein
MFRRYAKPLPELTDQSSEKAVRENYPGSAVLLSTEARGISRLFVDENEGVKRLHLTSAWVCLSKKNVKELKYEISFY